MHHPDLITRCTACLGEIRIARDAAQHGRQIVCSHCGTPAYIWQLIGRANREPDPLECRKLIEEARA